MIAAETIPCVILAGGQSRRMGGGDKGLLKLGQTTILGHVVDRISKQTKSIALNVNGDPARFSEYDLPCLADEISDFSGPLAGVLAAMEWGSAQNCEWVMTVAADTPFFPNDLMQNMAHDMGKDGAKIVMATSQDPVRGLSLHPTFGLWSTDLRQDLRAALKDGMRKIISWADRHGVAKVEFEWDKIDPFFNINTPDDLTRATGFLQEMSL